MATFEEIQAWAERGRNAQAAIDALLGPHGGRPASDPPEAEPLLTPAEVAALFGVDPKTVRTWADAGKFGPGAVIRTPSGHRRYKAGPVLAMRDRRTR